MVKITKLDDNNLEKIKGGEVVSAIWIGIAISTAIIFISGIIEGITNPKRCNS